MRKNIILSGIALGALLCTLIFFSTAYKKVIEYTALIERGNNLYSGYRELSKELNNAAVIHPDLVKAADPSKGKQLFFATNETVSSQVIFLKATAVDSQNIQIVEQLDELIKAQLPWIINSNIPDSIVHHNASARIEAFKDINHLIDEGIQQTRFLIGHDTDRLRIAITNEKIWMISFSILSIILIFYAGYIFYQQDSETKRASATQKNLLASIINSSEDGIISKTLDGIITSWNKSAETIFGYTEKEAIGRSISMIIPSFLTNEEAATVNRIKMGEFIAPYETERTRKDGSLISISLTVSPILDAKGNITGASKIVRDITEKKKADAAVMQANNERNVILESIDDAFFAVDKNWVVTYWNNRAEKMLQKNKAEMLGNNLWQIFSDSINSLSYKKYHEALDSNEVIHLEDHYDVLNKWYEISAYPSENGLAVYFKDITERKRTEIHLTELNESLELQADHLVRSNTELEQFALQLSQSIKEVKDYKFALDEANIVAITDQKGIIKYVNDNFCKISKYTNDELIGQDHRIINSGYHSKEFIKNIWATIAHGKIWKGELKNKAKDGTIYWVDTTIVPFLDNNGKPYQYVAIRADITERKRSEIHLIELNESLELKSNELARSNAELEQYARQLSQSIKEVKDYKFALDEANIVAITDQKGIIKYVNDNFCRISKYASNELIGQDHRIINSGYHPKEFIKELWTTIAHGKIWKGELKNKAKDDSIYWVDTTIVPFLDDKGKPYQYVAIRADITERKRSEIYLTELNQHLLNQTKELERSNAELEQFAYVASHDLQEPLRMITSFLTQLEKKYADIIDDKGKTYIGFAVDGAKRMRQIILDLLEFSRVGKTDDKKQNLDINELIKEIRILFRKQIEEKNATIGTFNLPVLHTYKVPLYQVFQNLISNALKYAAKDKPCKIEISATDLNTHWQFTVADNGIGINPEFFDKIFIIFQRLHNKDEYSGTGMGLAITKKIIDSLGGKIWVGSEEGKGSAFYFTIKK
jgi:PAS domain S-box-containing protein